MKNLPISTVKTSQPKPKPDINSLGFGKYFTDHMFIAKYTTEKGWYEASVKPYQSLELDPGASVLHYGQALFEGMKAFRQMNGRIALFRPDFNYERSCLGAERLCMICPPKDLFMNGIRELVKIDNEWMPEPPGALYIRPTLIGTEPFLGVRPSHEFVFFVILSPVSTYYAEGTGSVKIWVEKEYLRAAPGGLGATKAAANYAASLKAALNAKKNGYSQVLWLDHLRENIEEVGTMNVFFVFDNEIVTPALSGSILNGGTRQCVIDLLKSWNKPVVERKIKLTEIMEASKSGKLKEAFGTGTAAVISPIGEFGSETWQTKINEGQVGEVSQKLYNELTAIQFGRAEDKFHWLQEI